MLFLDNFYKTNTVFYKVTPFFGRKLTYRFGTVGRVSFDKARDDALDGHRFVEITIRLNELKMKQTNKRNYHLTGAGNSHYVFPTFGR